MVRSFVLGCLLVVGCSSSDDAATSPPCASDDQCKGSRICVAGVCVDPEGGVAASGGSGGGGSGTGGGGGHGGSSAGAGGTASGGASGGTGGSGACTSVLDCSASFRALLETLPDCKPCLLGNCAKDISGCGPRADACAASVACFVEPYTADYGPSGTCKTQTPKTPLWCYVDTDACVTVRAGEPAGFAFTQCMAQNCETECGLKADCTAGFPSCSTLAL